jgi:hypothetical protein
MSLYEEALAFWENKKGSSHAYCPYCHKWLAEGSFAPFGQILATGKGAIPFVLTSLSYRGLWLPTNWACKSTAHGCKPGGLEAMVQAFKALYCSRSSRQRQRLWA